MDIRISGTKEDIALLVEDLRMFYDIATVSRFYPNTRHDKSCKEGRVYVKINIRTVQPDNTIKIL